MVRWSARGEVFRSALLFSPFLALALAALAYIAADIARDGVTTGRVVGLVLLGGISLLLSYQVAQSVRDLFAQPVETTGLVEKVWSRHEFLLFRHTYIFVERNVFRISPEAALEIERGHLVRVVHYPHTSTVETVERVESAHART